MVRPSGCPRHHARATTDSAYGREDEGRVLPHGQDAQVQPQPRRGEAGRRRGQVQGLVHAQQGVDRPGQEREQERDVERGHDEQQRVLDLLQHQEVVEQDVLPLRAEEGVGGGSHRDEAEPQVLAQLGAAAMELEVIEAGDEEHGRRGSAPAARRASPAASGRRWGPIRNGPSTRAGTRALVSGAFQPRMASTTRPDGSMAEGGISVGAVAVVFDARVRGQAAHAAEPDSAREHLVGAVDLAQGQRRGRPARPPTARVPARPSAGTTRTALRGRPAAPIPWGPAARSRPNRRSPAAPTPGRLRTAASTSPRWTAPRPGPAAGPPCRGSRQRRPRPGSMRSAPRRTCHDAAWACSANSSTSARSCTRRAGGRLSRKRRP